MNWSSSNRRSQLPADWAERRLKVKRRARGRCQAVEHVEACDGVGAECDHIGDPLDHSLANLQWLSKPCHQAKTQREARAGRRTQRRPAERHPGLR